MTLGMGNPFTKIWAYKMLPKKLDVEAVDKAKYVQSRLLFNFGTPRGRGEQALMTGSLDMLWW